MIKRILCTLLCLATLFITLCPRFAAAETENETVYIKEIVTVSAGTDSAAKKSLVDKGYTVLPYNLNAGTDEDPVYLGYKTTDNRSEALTDISFMDMNGGYDLMDYTAFATQNAANISEMTRNLALACKEFAENLKNGSRAAQIALSYLNIFTVPEKSQKLGDYLLDTKRTDTEYRKILLVCNSLVINIIYTELSLGCSETAGNTWIERLSANGPDESLRGEDYEAYWSQQSDLYSHDAENIVAILKAFAKEYAEAEERKNQNGGEIVASDIETVEEAQKQLELFAECRETDDSSARDALVFSAFEYLNQFNYISTQPAEEADGYRLFPKSQKLGDVLLELSKVDAEDEDELSLLYPMVEALTPAQRHLICTQGLAGFVSFSAADSDLYQELEQKRDEYAQMLYNALASDTASVWIGTNEDLFNSKIGLTTKAKRDADAANDYDQLTKVTKFDTDIKVALCYIGGAAAAAAGVTLIALGLGALVFHGVGATIVCGMMIMGGAISATITGVAFGCVGVIGIAVTGLILAALIICAIVYAVDYFIDLYDYYNPDYTDIPKVMVDSDGENYIIYKAVNGIGGKPSDLNVWEGRRWNALYVTTDTNAGEPLTLNESGKAFDIVYGSTKRPNNATPVVRFGGKNAVNLNSNAYDDDVNGIYMYFYQLVEDITEPTDDWEESDAVYLESLILYTHEDARVVKNLIAMQDGYTLIDYNLTSDTDYATYIGYTTTKNPKNAITDIRVSYGGNGGKYYYGTVTDTYGMAGTTAKDTEGEDTGLLTSLYYTKSSKRGTPIYADLLVTGTKPTDLTGLEPVNLFSGGDAFDFNIYAEEDSDTWKKHTYIYFKPMTAFDESNSQLYLGGISFVSGSTDMSQGKLDAYVKELGLTSSGIDLSKGFFNEEDRTWLCYTTTYNPYRAIYDIGVYTAEYKSEYLIENLVLDGSGYVACQTFTQGDRGYYGNWLWGGNYRMIRPDHAYISRTEDYGGCDEYGDTLVCNRGMYVSGPIDGKDPISMETFKISKSATIPDGCVAVHDMTDKYATKALNLAMSDGEHKNQLYIFFEGTAPVKQKYISKISVFFSDEEDYSYDTVMYQLMAAGGDEIIRVNLAGESDDSWKYTDGNACFDEDSDRDDYDDAHAFIRVTRTKTKNEGIGSVCLVEGSKGGSGTLTLNYNLNGKTALYTCAGNKITYDEDKSYYLYYSTVGNKISDLKIDKVAVQHDWITALNENLKLCTNAGYYIHTYSDVSLPYYSLVMLHRSDDKLKSISALLAAGCTDVERINVDGDPVYIGWAKTSAPANGIKDVIFSSTNKLLDGYENYVSGGSAHGIYIFYTTAGEKTKAITHMKVSTSVPTEFGSNLKWEYAQSNTGKAADLNTVVGNSNTKKVYRLYVNHKDNRPFSENSLMASAISDFENILCLILLIIIPLIIVTAAILIRKNVFPIKKKKGE